MNSVFTFPAKTLSPDWCNFKVTSEQVKSLDTKALQIKFNRLRNAGIQAEWIGRFYLEFDWSTQAILSAQRGKFVLELFKQSKGWGLLLSKESLQMCYVWMVECFVLRPELVQGPVTLEEAQQVAFMVILENSLEVYDEIPAEWVVGCDLRQYLNKKIQLAEDSPIMDPWD